MTDEAKDTGLLHVLLVEDEDSLRIPLAKYLERECSYEVTQAAHAKEVRRLLSRGNRPFDVALVDDLLAPSAKKEPEYLGITLLREIKDRWPETEIIIFTGWGMERALEALQAGAYRYLEKPVNPEELRLTIRMAAEQARLRKERGLLSAALEISNAMVSAADVDRALEVIAAAIPRLTGADACAVARIDPVTGKIRHEPVILLGDTSVIWTRHLRHRSLTQQIAESGEPYAVADTDARAEELDENLCQSGVKSFIGVPIPAEVRNLGALYAYSLRPDAFSVHEEQVLTLLAQQAGIALVNARLFDTTRRASEQLSALNQVVLEIGKELDRQALLMQVLDQAIKLLAAEGGAVYLLDPTGEYFTMEVAAGLRLDLKGQRIGRSEGLSGKILRTAEPQKVTNYYHWQKRLRILDAHKLRAVAGAPIRVGDHILGTLVVHDTRPEKKFDDTALTLLQRFANHVGLALQKVALLEKRQVIQQMSTTITSALELEEVLNRTCQAAVELFGVDHSGLVLFDQDLDWGTVEGEYPAQPNTSGERIPIKGVPAEERLAFKGETLVFSDVEEVESDLGPVLDIWRRFNIRSILLVPIIFQNRVLGSFSLDAVGHTRQFKEEEVELCKVFAAHVAVAVENAELFAQTQRDLHMVSRLYEISSQVDPVHDLNRTLELIATSVKEAAGALSVSITTLDPAGRPYEKAHTGFSEEERVKRRHGLSMRVMQTGELCIIPDVSQTSESVNPGMIRDGVKAAICLPLQARGKNIGVMWVTYAQPHCFTNAEIKLMGLLASQTSTVIETARVFQERQLLLDTSKVISSAQDLDQSLQTLAERLVKSLVVTFCRISLLDDTGRMLTIRAAYPILNDLPWTPGIKQQYALKEAPEEAKAIETGQRQVLRREETPDSLSRLEQRTNFQGVLKWAVLIPLAVGGKVFGVITLGERRSWERGSYALERIALCESMADQVAALIARMRLLEQVSKARDAARHIASVMILEDLPATLESIVKATKEVADCDAVTLYAYNQDTDDFVYPPTTLGLRDEKGVRWLDYVDRNSVVWKVLALDRPHIAEDAPSDSLMMGQQQGKVPPFIIREAIKSSVGLPLKAGDRKVGVMFVNYRSSHRFATDKLTNIKLFANQAAVAIRNAQLYEQVQKRATALQALYEAGGAVASTLALNEILRRIVEQAWRLAVPRGKSTHFSHLAWVDGNKMRFIVAYPQDVLPELTAKVGEIDLEHDERIGITGRVAKTGKPELVGDTTQDCDYIEFDANVHSQLSVPIKIGEQVIGVVTVEHPDCSAFDEEDLQALVSLATQAAIAIHNAQLYQEATERLDESQTLQQVAVSLVGTLELQELLNLVMEAAMKLTNTDSGGILFWDSQTKMFTRTLTTTGPNRALQPYRSRVRREGGIARMIIDQRKPIVIPDSLRDPRVSPVAIEKGRRALVGVPLLSREEVIGVLFVNSSEPREFPDRQVRLLEAFASQAALAIEKARRHRELLEMHEQLAAKSALAWMGMAGSTWAHSVTTKAIVIKETAQALRGLVATAHSPEKIEERLKRIEDQAEEIQKMPITVPLSTEEGVGLVGVNTLLRERIPRVLEQHGEDVQIKWCLRLPDVATVKASPEWLRRALDILVENALEAMAESPVKVLTVSSEAKGGTAEIGITDTGKGIPEQDRAKLFREPVPRDKGTGMGLLLALTIVQAYGGDIRLETTGPLGTTMVISLRLE